MHIIPEPSQPAGWKFIDDLKLPANRQIDWRRTNALPNEYDLRSGIHFENRFPDPEGLLETAFTDLSYFLNKCGISKNGSNSIAFVMDNKLAHEEYKIEVRESSCTLSASDSEGMRRAIYFLEDMIASSDGPFLKISTVTRKPFIKTRISRCFFGPIKRPPFNRDELMDDVDYYPDEYLNRLAHESINGLWLTITFKDLCKTSLTPEYGTDAEKRFSKLRATINKCLRYGIKIYIFCIEPAAFDEDSPVIRRHPEMAGLPHEAKKCFCPFSETSKQYLYEAVNTIFKNAPGLGGMINISLGERLTTCINIDSMIPSCERCKGHELWQIHYETVSAMEKGMRTAAPEAEFISWLYVPLNNTGNRKDFACDIAAHVPENVILQYNFESGGEKVQLGKKRFAGDYWLSYAGPSEIFKEITENAVNNGSRMSAKLQVGCSHEVASIPFVPVPSQLFKKYREMKDQGVSSAMQCWYFGNYPGLMNKAAGELSFEPFPATEDEFLLQLAKPEWGKHASKIAEAWKIFADAYENYPVNVLFQYYGPMHDGIVWPLHLKQENLPLCPTWKLDYPPSGDMIRECFYDSHSYDEILTLCQSLSEGWDKGVKILKSLEDNFKDIPDRIKDIGLAEALGILFSSGFNILKFYRLREKLYSNDADKKTLLADMKNIVEKEIALSSRMLELCLSDSRLGYHSEAEGYKFFPEKLKWRIELLKQLINEEFPAVARMIEQKTLSPSDWTETAGYVCGSASIVKEKSFEWQADVKESTLNIKAKLFDMPGNKISGDILRIYIQPFPEWPVLTMQIETKGEMRGVNLGPKERISVTVSEMDGKKVIEVKIPLDYVSGMKMNNRIRFNISRSFQSGEDVIRDSWIKDDPLKMRLTFWDANPKYLGILAI